MQQHFFSSFIFPLCVFMFVFFKVPPYHQSPILCVICLVSHCRVRGTSTFTMMWQNFLNEKREKYEILWILSLILRNNWFSYDCNPCVPFVFCVQLWWFLILALWAEIFRTRVLGQSLGAELQDCKSGYLHNAHPALLDLGCSAQLFPLDFISAIWRQL